MPRSVLFSTRYVSEFLIFTIDYQYMLRHWRNEFTKLSQKQRYGTYQEEKLTVSDYHRITSLLGKMGFTAIPKCDRDPTYHMTFTPVPLYEMLLE
jgi:hypothetical protein